MIPGELAGLYYELHPENPISLLLDPNSPNNTNLNNMSNVNYETAPNQLYSSYFLNNNNNLWHNFQTPSCPSSNASSVSDEAADQEEEQQQQYHNQQEMRMMIDERRQRRMISNRESARRSRMRKQKHLDELWSQVLRLRTENHGLIEKLNRAAESHDLVVQENSRLKEEASDLRQMLSHLSVGTRDDHHLASLNH